MRKAIFLLFLTCFWGDILFAQCPTQSFSGVFTVANGQFLNGTYNISGIFFLAAGDTAWVTPYSTSSCGVLEIYADSVRIEGVIMALGAGYEGGQGGIGGSCADSVRFQDCSLASQCLGINNVMGGLAGLPGNIGLGSGNVGANGALGRGRKNSCNTTSDRVGRVGASGGAGGGSGGSYGGLGNISGLGAAGTLPVASANSVDNFCVPANAVPISAGLGGAAPTLLGGIYGTANGTDIDLGSGGGGAGGGGRGYFPAGNGGKGGNGGGVVKIVSVYGMYISGTINANGEAGGTGGKGGDAGESARCCTDLCPQVNEHTYVGAGGGGGGGGGGSGGGVYLESTGNLIITGQILAEGGAPGAGGIGGISGAWAYQEPAFICGTATGLATSVTTPAASNGTQGGGGGGGRIKIVNDNCGINTLAAGVCSVNAGAPLAAIGTIAQASTTFSPPSGAISSPSQSYCAGAIGDTIMATIPSPYYSPLYQWQFQPDCNGIWNNIGTSTPYFVPNFIDTACVRLVVTYGLCTTIYQDTIVVNVSSSTLSLNIVNNNPTICANSVGSLSLSQVLPAGSTLQWYYNNVPIPSANGGTATPLVNITNSGTYHAEVQVLGNLCSIMTDTTTITINPLPVASLASVNNDTLYCEGGNGINLIATPSTNVSYQWFQDFNLVTGSTNTLTAMDSGAYFVVIMDANGCRDTSASLSISIYPKPQLSLSPSAYSIYTNFVSPNFCEGDTVLLTASTGTILTWWQNGLPIPGTNNFSSILIQNSGNYSAILTEGPGCMDTASFTLSEIPAPNTTIFTSATSFCVGDSVLLVANGATTYQWQSPSTNQDSIFVSQGGTYCVVGYEPILGCADTACTPPLSILQQAIASLQVLGDTVLCQGETTTLQASGGNTFQWLLNGVPILGATNATLTVSSQGNYAVIAAYSAVCLDTSETQFIQYLNNPTASIALLSPNPACAGDTVFLQGSGGLLYEWIVPNGAITSNLAAYNGLVAGDYQVIVTDNAGCKDTSSLVNISFFANPTPLIVLANGTNPTCVGVDITLATTLNFNNYQWFRNGVLMVGETQSTLQTSLAGSYTVSVIDANGCIGLSAPFVVQNTGIVAPNIIGDTLICAGEDVLWTVQPANFTTYQWLNQNGTLPIPGANGATFMASVPDGYRVIVSKNGCTDTSDVRFLQLAPKPTVSINQPSALSICKGDSITLFATGANTYQWYRNTTLIGGTSGDSLRTGLVGYYFVVGTNLEGCKDTSSQTAVSVLSGSSIKVNAPDGRILCGGDSIRLITEIGNGGTFSAWLKDGIPLVDSSSILYVTEPGNYQVVAEHFCGADTTPFIVVTSFEITADFGFSPQDEIFVSENILFSDNSSPEPQLWFWDFGDDFTSNSPNPTHNYTLSGTYPVSLVVQNIQGCKDTLIRNITIFDQGTLFIPTAFTPNDDGNNDIFSVKGLEITELSLSIWDRWGKLIYEIRQVGDGWDGTVEGEDAPEGVYMCSYSYTLRGGRAKKGTSSITLTR